MPTHPRVPGVAGAMRGSRSCPSQSAITSSMSRMHPASCSATFWTTASTARHSPSSVNRVDRPSPSSPLLLSPVGGTVSPRRSLCAVAGQIVAPTRKFPLGDSITPGSLEGVTMRTPTLLGLTITVAAVLACGDSQGPGEGSGVGGGGSAAVLLKDVVVAHLPSPYYHFEYEPDGRIKRVSFASDFLIYDVLYQDGRIAELRND